MKRNRHSSRQQPVLESLEDRNLMSGLAMTEAKTAPVSAIIAHYEERVHTDSPPKIGIRHFGADAQQQSKVPFTVLAKEIPGTYVGSYTPISGSSLPPSTGEMTLTIGRGRRVINNGGIFPFTATTTYPSQSLAGPSQEADSIAYQFRPIPEASTPYKSNMLVGLYQFGFLNMNYTGGNTITVQSMQGWNQSLSFGNAVLTRVS